MKKLLVRSRDLLVFRGVMAVLFGVATLLSAGVAIPTLALLFATYVLFDGISAVAFARRHAAHEHTWLIVLKGIVGIALAIAIFARLQATDRPLVVAIGAWALLTGVFEMGVAFHLKPEVPNEVFVAAAGAISVVLGIAIFAVEPTSAIALVVLLGSFEVLFGASLIGQVALLTGPEPDTQNVAPPPSRQREA
jgi:uncharacterized membrane protein HdeD (DUF308 family)